MSYIAIKAEEKKKKDLLELYNTFMSKEKSKPESFESLDEFMKSAAYEELSEEEKEHFQQHKGEHILILKFDDVEQAINFIKKAQLKGFFTKEQAKSAISQINDQNQSSHRMGM